jgi:hypothetical protein
MSSVHFNGIGFNHLSNFIIVKNDQKELYIYFNFEAPRRLDLEEENRLLRMQISELKNLIVNLCFKEKQA